MSAAPRRQGVPSSRAAAPVSREEPCGLNAVRVIVIELVNSFSRRSESIARRVESNERKADTFPRGSGGLVTGTELSARFVACMAGTKETHADAAKAIPRLANPLPNVTNTYPGVTFAYPGVTYAYPQVTFAYPPVTDTYPPVTDTFSPVTNAYPQVTDSYPQVTNTYPQVTNTFPGKEWRFPCGLGSCLPGRAGVVGAAVLSRPASPARDPARFG
jgi:hypothetical protein